MKKIILLLFCVCPLCLFAETWGDFVIRLESMDRNAENVSYNRSPDDWSYDEIGAVYATYVWLYAGYMDIVDNYDKLNLSKSKNYYIQRRNYYKQMRDTMLSFINGFYVTYRRIIDEKYKYWFNYLEKEGNYIRF